MALKPIDDKHAAQIDAGIKGRNQGHKFEALLTLMINELNFSRADLYSGSGATNVVTGNPAIELVKYIIENKGIDRILDMRAWWLGGLATSGKGDVLVDEFGKEITKCKADVLIEIEHANGVFRTGVSVKTCSKPQNTNAQLFFTTASAFCNQVRRYGIPVSETAEQGLKMFCGDAGYRPIDTLSFDLSTRLSDPNRWYWEELPSDIRDELEHLFRTYQDEITVFLLQRAYENDPYPPEFILHQVVKYDDIQNCKLALFSIHEFIQLSRQYSGFILNPYTINKGTYKADTSVHLAPRFGFVQFQRGGQKQHPTQLQFNLKAGYYKHI